MPIPRRDRIQPRISSMPRQQSEAATHRQMYQLLVEKQRLLQELQHLEQRRYAINQRLEGIATQLIDLEYGAGQLQQKSAVIDGQIPASDANSMGFETMFLEY
ncbi:hypothetical protein [[Phormidium] sp. ETS-05]|uniref:hypothetical protein n=1 Tax=[Phormidium] sp. ETS-05 TaxID=222819 RepID=UPI0018EF0199|nr:hypothetical protein [[Phormidium] sp. ETS-05]